MTLEALAPIVYSMLHEVRDRGFDRGENRFYCVVGEGQASPGAVLETIHGPRIVKHVGRTFGDPPKCYAYLDLEPSEIGAPVDALTPEQEARRAEARRRLLDRGARVRAENDAKARAAVLAALDRDGWSSRRNTVASDSALGRVYAQLVAEGAIELRRYWYVRR